VFPSLIPEEFLFLFLLLRAKYYPICFLAPNMNKTIGDVQYEFCRNKILVMYLELNQR
jgi:hypothetical protein